MSGKRDIFFGFVLLCLMACSPRALHEAQMVVAQTDSLRAEGRMYEDSLALAQTYKTLDRWQWFYADDYAHACYHYGRLLREKDNPAAAMEYFINAYHTRTREYHILGRVYSNMADICHLAGDFPLACDLFSQAAQWFLTGNDTLSYCYALNSAALEWAEQGKEEETLRLVRRIRELSNDSDVQAGLSLTQAILYEQLGQYDSVLHILLNDSLEASCLVVKARAFEHTGQTDSALYYAKEVLAMPSASAQDRYNMLYILINYDTTLQNDELVILSSTRSDIETSTLTPLQGHWTLATRILIDDLTRKPDLKWLYAIIITLLIVSAGILLDVCRKRQKHALLAQQLEDLKHATSTVKEKHEELFELYEGNRNRIRENINRKCELLLKSGNISSELAWSNYENMCRKVDERFYMLATKLQQKHVLNETEIRMCVLVLIGLHRKEIADALPYAQSGIGKLKDHTAKLLGTTGKNLHDFLLNMAVEG